MKSPQPTVAARRPVLLVVTVSSAYGRDVRVLGSLVRAMGTRGAQMTRQASTSASGKRVAKDAGQEACRKTS